MTTTACIIQARLGSTRLPAKVLLPLPTGRTVLEEVVFRCRQIKGIDVVVVAVADDAGSDIVTRYADKAAEPYYNYFIEIADRVNAGLAPVKIVRGPEHDVLKRYIMAAEEVKADIIMRVTADCPLIDPVICTHVLRQRAKLGLAYCCNNMPRTYPHGFDCEVFTMGMLRNADMEATDPEDREHVTPLMRRLVTGAHGVNVASEIDRSHIRLTLDTIEDYQAIWKEFERRSRLDEAA